MKYLAIDPGQKGAFCFMENGKIKLTTEMPLKANKDIDYDEVVKALEFIKKDNPLVILERAHPGAMGVTGAFNYGRGFAALEIAIGQVGFSVVYLEPAKWTKVMHQGVNQNYKPKIKSLIAMERLYPSFFKQMPRTRKTKNGKGGNVHDGIVDAVLMAGYAHKLKLQPNTISDEEVDLGF